MSNSHVQYIVVGGGMAANAAAKAIRALDSHGDLLLIGQEIHRPYERPPLSKDFLLRKKPKGELFAESSEWYAPNHVRLQTGRRVTHVDCARNSVTLDTGEEFSFGKLLLATGGAPTPLQIPGASLPNLLYVRTIEDAERLHHAIDKARGEGRMTPKGRGKATVIGAGLLGVELASSLSQSGLSVELVTAREYPCHRFGGEAIGMLLTRYMQSRGVEVHLRNRAVRLEGDGRVQRVILADGKSIDCDFAVAAVGMTVHRQHLRGTPIIAEKAILVDARCRTSQPNIFAAGDCAAVLDPLFGKHRLIDHQENAIITGTIAGTNMAGGEAVYDAVSRFDVSVFDLRGSVWGDARWIHHRLLRGSTNFENPDVIEIGIGADGAVVQTIALGHAGHGELLQQMVARKVSVLGREEQLRDPAFDLAKILE